MSSKQSSCSVSRKFIFLATLIASLAVSESARADSVDTVLLKGGGRVRGTIMVDDPKTGVSIRLLDGTTRDVKRADIQEVDYATPQSAAPAPVAPPPPAAAPSPSHPALPPVAYGSSSGDAAATNTTAPPPPMRSTRPHRADYDEGSGDDDGSRASNAPSGSHYESRSLKGLWVAGLVIDLSVWALRGAITAGACASLGGCKATSVGGAATPVIGAWIQLSSGVGDGNGQNNTGYAAALVTSGIVETAGFIMFVTGLAVHKKHLVRDTQVDLGPVRVAPLFGGSTNGISGSF